MVGLVSRTIFKKTTLFNTENLRIWVILHFHVITDYKIMELAWIDPLSNMSS